MATRTPEEQQIHKIVHDTLKPVTAAIGERIDKMFQHVDLLITKADKLEQAEQETEEGFKTLHNRIAGIESKPDLPLDETADKLDKRIDGVADVVSDYASSFEKRIETLESIAEGPAESTTPAERDRAALYGALAKAQGEIQAAEANKTAEIRKKDDYNVVLYTFKYADLAACLEVIRKPLSDNGLALIQIPSLGDNNSVHMRTVLAHESGQTISCEMTMYAEKGTPQAIGTCMAYLRRYSLCSLIGVAQFDDDAANTGKDPNDYDRITIAEVDKIIYTADEEFGDRADAAIKKMLNRVFGVSMIGDIKAGEADVAITNLQNAAKLMQMNDESAKQAEEAEKAAADADAEDEK